MVSLLDLMKYLLGVVVVLCTAFYLFLRKRYKYWEQRGVPGPKPRLFFGNTWRLFKLELSEGELMNTFYDQFPNERYIGIYVFWLPILLVRDLELIKNMCITDFQHFTDHPNITDGHGTDRVASGIFFMKGDAWRNRRQIISKTLTPRRLKEYSFDLNGRIDGLLQDICKTEGRDVNLIQFLNKTTAKFLLSSFYGLEMTGKEEMLETYLELNDAFFYPPASSVIKSLLYSVCPSLYSALGVRTFAPKIWKFHLRVTGDILASRKMEDKRNDFITLMMKHMGQDVPDDEKMDFNEVVGHVFNWFLASHHTTMLGLSHFLLRLSMNPDIQDKVLEEIDTVSNKLTDNEFLDYEAAGKMVYFEAVFNEAQRINPIVSVQKRICNKEYPLSGKFNIPVGMEIYFPVSGLHRDPAYFPEPDVFRPERFIEDPSNQAFMAFGKGPRICIGARFADLMAKLVLGNILRKYRVEESSKMKFPMVFDPQAFFISNMPLGGIWLKFSPRNPVS